MVGIFRVPLTIAIQLAWREIMANLRLNYGNSLAFFLPFFPLILYSFFFPFSTLDPRTDCVDGPDFVFVAFQEEGRIFVYATGSGGWECEARNLMTEQLLIK